MAAIKIMVDEMNGNFEDKLKSKHAKLKEYVCLALVTSLLPLSPPGIRAERELAALADRNAKALASRKATLHQQMAAFEDEAQKFQQDQELHAKQNPPRKRTGFKFGH